jgi:ferredoxin--NADP+ reductase
VLFWEAEMREASTELHICTDDGSYGEKGFVTNILHRLLEGNNKVHRVWAIGPMPMMRAVSGVTLPFNVPTIVSLNPIMVDGTGMCGACRVQVGSETKFACVDGPEFDGHKVDWQLAIKRLAMFKDKEAHACTAYEDGGKCSCQ